MRNPWFSSFLVSCNPLVTNDHGYGPLVVTISRSFPHSRLITGFVNILTQRVPTKDNKYVVNQKLEHIDDISFRELFGRIRVLYFYKIMSLPTTRITSQIMYSRHHDLVDRYGISVSQMTTDMFQLA
jgi:hypothetical protein